MRNHWKVGLLVCIFAVVKSTTGGARIADGAEAKSVSAATAQFHSALNSIFKGEIGPMEEVWSHADDVTFMGPAGGMLVGWDQVRAHWKERASKRLEGEVNAEKMRIHVGREIAVTCGYEVGEIIVDGKPQKVSIRATSVFRKENGQWKMIGHHTDLLPFLEK